ncbi:MAG: FAD-dependent oxidoreductase [Euryarchaeota archaeon]|nr:FAD-dependent oxidoreductase [Euryarchaeota archaeon]
MPRPRYVVIGDGISGATAAVTLRKNSADCDITVLSDELEPLYNRVKIKDFAKGSVTEQSVRMHDAKFYKDNEIELRLGTPVRNIYDVDKQVVTEDGESIPFDKLLIATGGIPRRHPAPGSDLGGIHRFWTFVDSRRIRAHAQKRGNGVAIGAGLLGIDIAVVFAVNGVKTRYIMRGDRWWREGISKVGSEIVEEAMLKKGIECVFHENPLEFKGTDGHVSSVVTDKAEYPCEIAGVAVGLQFNTRLIAGTKVKLGEGILTDEKLQTSVPGIYAAGDIVQFYDVVQERVNMNGSWASAKKTGEVAAMNMLGKDMVFRHVDTYSINHFEFMIGSVGSVLGTDAIEVKLGPKDYRRVVFKGDRCVGAVFIGSLAMQGKFSKLIDGKVDISGKKELLLEKDVDLTKFGLAARAPAPVTATE